MDLMESVRVGIRNPGKAMQAIGRRLLGTVGHRGYRRFIVLSRSRTGSNLLVEFLNSHPHIHAQGEIFGKLGGRDFRDVLAGAFSRQPYYVKASGFKIFYYHPQDEPSSGVWDALQAMDDLCVIHLKRRNLLRTLLSRRIASRQDVWAVNAGARPEAGNEPVTVAFTVERLTEAFRRTRAWEDLGDQRFRGHRVLTIHYEDFANGDTREFAKVTEMLGLHYQPPKAALRKQNERSLREMLGNYDELKAAFAGTEWAGFFED